jgi:predicted CxxxxCH...CXXCH cytochrome family protein
MRLYPCALLVIASALTACGGGAGQPLDAAVDTPDVDAASDAAPISDATIDAAIDAAPEPACATCHGDATTAAPPLDTTGGQSPLLRGVGAHRAHLTTGAFWHRDLACADCHVVPPTRDSLGHVDSALPAELVWSPLAGAGGITPAFDGVQCTTYCHGAGLTGGTNPRPRWASGEPDQAACGACHGLPPGPPHPAATQCSPCHPSVDVRTPFLDATNHIDGVVELRELACDSCHGSAGDPAPPTSVTGQTATTARGVGAHRSHLRAAAWHAPVALRGVPRGAGQRRRPRPRRHRAAGRADVRAAGDRRRRRAELRRRHLRGRLLPRRDARRRQRPDAHLDPRRRLAGRVRRLPRPAAGWQPPGRDRRVPRVVQRVPRRGDRRGRQLRRRQPAHRRYRRGGRDQLRRVPRLERQPGAAARLARRDRDDRARGRRAPGAPGAVAVARPDRVRGVPPRAGDTDRGRPRRLAAPGRADVRPAGERRRRDAQSFDGVTCQSAYCHGATLAPGGADTTPTWTLVDGSQDACGTCHGLPPSAPHPAAPGMPPASCAPCHGAVVAANGTFVNPALHIDGVVEVVRAGRATACHGAAGDPRRPATRSATCSPPPAASARTAATCGLPRTGARRSAATSATASRPTSTAPATATRRCPPSSPSARWPAADGAVPAFDGTTCTGAYCHGATLRPGGTDTTPTWTTVDGSQAACGTCHGLPPGRHPPAGRRRGPGRVLACHDQVIAPDGSFANPALHIDGIVEVVAA